MKPYRCPVCNGNGLVPNGFYNQTSGSWSANATTPETCQSCNGIGIVWEKGAPETLNAEHKEVNDDEN